MYVWYDTVLYLVPTAGLFAPYFYTDLISLYVHASPSWHVCPIAGNLFNPGTHAESSYVGDTGLLLTTYMNRDSWHDMRKMNFPFYYFDLKCWFLTPKVNQEMPLLSPWSLRTYEFLIFKFDDIFSIHYLHSAHAMVHNSAPWLNTKTLW